jgi:hypothetical protein
MNTEIIWTEDEILQLRNLYKTTSNREIGVILNKSRKNVTRKLKRLNLFRTNSERKVILSKDNKKRGRDLSFEFVASIAKKYKTRGEFYNQDSSAYCLAIKKGWIDDITKHMILKNSSYPQLILKDILEFILSEQCIYNDRKTIKPLEIDCYFPKWKIGWEYNGSYYHSSDEKDQFKIEKCNEKNILLLIIDEKNLMKRDYIASIKDQLIQQIPAINERTSLNITSDKIVKYTPKTTYPSKVKKTTRKCNRFAFKNDYMTYLRSKNFKSFSDLCKQEHPHRMMKKWNCDVKEVKNLFK